MLYRIPAFGYNGPMLSAKSLPDLTQEQNRLAELTLIPVRLAAALGAFLLALAAVRPVAAAVAAGSLLTLGALAVTAAVRARASMSLDPLLYPGMALDAAALLAMGFVAVEDRGLSSTAVPTLVVLETYGASLIIVAAFRLSVRASLIASTVALSVPLVLGAVAATRLDASVPSWMFAEAGVNAVAGALATVLSGRNRAVLLDNIVTEDLLRASRRLRMTMDIVSASIYYLQQLIDRLGDISATLAAGARTQLSRVEQATNAGESARAAVQRISLAAQVANQTISRVSKSSETGKSLVGKVAQQILGSREVVNRMMGSLSRISELAGQTSLLTLNAAIEAARVAEERSGFPMIAEEIRQLAEKTTQGAGEASKWGRQVEEVIQQGGESFQDAGKVFDTIARDLSTLGSHIRDLSGSVKEQTGAGQEASSAIEGISAVVEDNRLSAEAVARTIGDLKKQMLKLQALVQDKVQEAEDLYRSAHSAE